MYVCICRAIREREVDAAVRAGARRPSDVFRACGTRPQCGTCACDMRQRIADTTTRAVMILVFGRSGSSLGGVSPGLRPRMAM